MSTFEFTDNYYVLCAVNLQIANNFLNFGVCIIDTYTNKAKVCEFTDNDFFTTVENILIQNAPSHEETKYYVLGNFPLDFYGQKFQNIIEKIELVDNKQVLINSKEFVNKNLDYFSTIKLMLVPIVEEQNSSIFMKNEILLGLSTLHGVIEYTRLLQFSNFQNKFTLHKYNVNEFMSFDMTCVKCLNLFDNFEEKRVYLSGNLSNNLFGNLSKLSAMNSAGANKTSVYSILNICCTKFGSRLLRTWILQPLQTKEDIETRLNIVELFLGSVYFKQEIRNTYLSKLDDIQSINMALSKYISKGDEHIIKLTDCAKLQHSISVCGNLLNYIKCYEGVNAELFFQRYVNTLEELIKRLSKLEEMLSKTLVFDSKSREYVINYNLNKELTNIQEKIDNCWSEIEEVRSEVEKKISENKKQKANVKIGEYEKHGYTLELTKIDGDNFLKSKLNASQFRLLNSNKANIVLNNKKMSELSQEIRDLKAEYKEKEKFYYKKVVEVTSTYHPLLERLMYILSELDVLASFATVIESSKEIYSKPTISTGRSLVLKDSRHIILEWNKDIILKNNPNNKNLIANDCILEEEANVKLITGINMGGKSTYLRQVGICVLLAHIGMYVPASQAEMPIVDQIFTRVGAGDIMLKGVSTYMNEMIEVCSLIKSATKDSLLLIDELGRGTSTDDGIAISYAILHYICTNINCYCLFATHFFELTSMEGSLSNVHNYFFSFTVEEGELLMEYKITKGKSSNSFGVNMFKSLKFDDDTCNTLKQFLAQK